MYALCVYVCAVCVCVCVCARACTDVTRPAKINHVSAKNHRFVSSLISSAVNVVFLFGKFQQKANSAKI